MSVEKPTRFPAQKSPSMTLTLKLDLKNKRSAPAHSLIKEAHRRLSTPNTPHSPPHPNTRTHTQKPPVRTHKLQPHQRDQRKRPRTVVYTFTAPHQTNDKTQKLLCYLWSALNVPPSPAHSLFSACADGVAVIFFFARFACARHMIALYNADVLQCRPPQRAYIAYTKDGLRQGP